MQASHFKAYLLLGVFASLSLFACKDNRASTSVTINDSDSNMLQVKFKDGTQELRIYRRQGQVQLIQLFENDERVSQYNLAVHVDLNKRYIDEVVIGQDPLVVYTLDSSASIVDARRLSDGVVDSMFTLQFGEWVKLQPSNIRFSK